MSAFPPFSKRTSRVLPRSFSSGRAATRSSTLSFVTRRFRSCFRQFITGHYHLWFLYMIVGLYLLIPLLRPIAAERNAHALLSAARAYLYVSSAPARPVSPPSSRRRLSAVIQTVSMYYLLLFSARLHRLFCRRILFKPQGTSAAERRSSSTLSALLALLFSMIAPVVRAQGAGRAERLSSTTTIRSMCCSPACRSSSLPSSI